MNLTKPQVTLNVSSQASLIPPLSHVTLNYTKTFDSSLPPIKISKTTLNLVKNTRSSIKLAYPVEQAKLDISESVKTLKPLKNISKSEVITNKLRKIPKLQHNEFGQGAKKAKQDDNKIHFEEFIELIEYNPEYSDEFCYCLRDPLSFYKFYVVPFSELKNAAEYLTISKRVHLNLGCDTLFKW